MANIYKEVSPFWGYLFIYLLSSCFKVFFHELSKTFIVTHRVTARNLVIPELVKLYRLFGEDISRMKLQAQSLPV